MALQRNIEVTVDGALPIDGYKAVIQRVQEYEKKIAKGETVDAISAAATDPALRVVVTSLSHYEVYVLDITDLDPAEGIYNLTVVSIGL